jgi:hypothetical protein
MQNAAALSAFEQGFLRALWALDAKKLSSLAQASPVEARELCKRDLRALNSESLGARDHDLERSIQNVWGLGNYQVREEAAGKRWADTIGALFNLGFKPKQSLVDVWRRQALTGFVSLPEFECLMDAGFFPKASLVRPKDGAPSDRHFLGAYGVDGLLRACVGAPCEPLDFVEKLVQAGFAGADDCCVGVSDFALAGLWGCAQRLRSLGFEAGHCRSPEAFGRPLLVALLSSFSPRGSARDRFGVNARRDPLVERDKVRAMARSLDRLATLGVSFDASHQDQALRNPFLALLASDGFSNERAPTVAMLDVLGAKILSWGADPNAGGWLHWACSQAAVDANDWNTQSIEDADQVWEWALSIGMNPSLFSAKILRSATWLRQENDAIKMAQKFVERGALPASIGRLDEDSPAHAAIGRDYHRLARWLVERGAPLDYLMPDGETALHLLSESVSRAVHLAEALKRPEMSALIESCSKAPKREGERPLHRACAALSIESMRALLERGADPNSVDAKGWTPLRHLLRKFGAGAQKKIEPALRLLLAAGADPSIADAKGLTPAQATAGKAPMAALERLLGLRPQDVAGENVSADQAKAALSRRGGRAASLSEKLQIQACASPLNPKEPAPKNRSRL